YSTPNNREFACANLVDRARGYGFEGYELDGTDLAQCLEVIGSAVKRARAGRPPQLVVASILRLAGHGEHDDFSYVTDDIRKEPFAQRRRSFGAMTNAFSFAGRMWAETSAARSRPPKVWRKNFRGAF